MVKAIEPTYLDAVRDRTSNTINLTVSEVMQHLFDSCGDVTPETFQAKESEVKAYTYDPTTPVDVLFTEIEDLVDLSGKANVPMTAEQAITIAYVILWRTTVLKDALKEWNALGAADKTWLRFKTHFRDAIKEYKQLRGPTVQNSIFQQHSANLIRDLRNELKTVIVEEIQRHTAHLAITMPPSSYDNPYVLPPQDDNVQS